MSGFALEPGPDNLSTEAVEVGHWVPFFGPTNSDRYPPFYELSARVERRFTLGPLKMAAYLEVMNITYAQNVFAYVYDEGIATTDELKVPERGALNHLPIRPFLGIRAEY